jgi:MYXO-CTERM domain-containing protein
VLTGDGKEKLALSEDGGDTLSIPLATDDGALSSFVRMADGTVLVGALGITQGRLFRSTDGGHSFTSLPTTPHPRALAERAGKLYAATDDVVDGYALAVSEDRGSSWRRVMSFKDIGSISHCGNLPGACANSCAMLRTAGLVTPTLCGPVAPDAGAGGGGGGRGCSCRMGAAGGRPAIFLLGLLVALRRRARR